MSPAPKRSHRVVNHKLLLLKLLLLKLLLLKLRLGLLIHFHPGKLIDPQFQFSLHKS